MTKVSVTLIRLGRYFSAKWENHRKHSPTTKAALIQHIRWSVYQGAICWGQCLIANQYLPCPNDMGWLKWMGWQPNWTTLPDAVSSCKEPVKSSCKLNCGQNRGVTVQDSIVLHFVNIEAPSTLITSRIA